MPGQLVLFVCSVTMSLSSAAVAQTAALPPPSSCRSRCRRIDLRNSAPGWWRWSCRPMAPASPACVSTPRTISQPSWPTTPVASGSRSSTEAAALDRRTAPAASPSTACPQGLLAVAGADGDRAPADAAGAGKAAGAWVSMKVAQLLVPLLQRPSVMALDGTGGLDCGASGLHRSRLLE